MKKYGCWTIILIIVFAFVFSVGKRIIPLQILGYRMERKITNMLQKERKNYKPAKFGGIQSCKVGSDDPPYFIRHIFSENGEEFKMEKFIFDKNLNIISEEPEDIIQDDSNRDFNSLDGKIRKGIINFQIDIIEHDFQSGKKYEALLEVNHCLKKDSTNNKLKNLKKRILVEINKDWK